MSVGKGLPERGEENVIKSLEIIGLTLVVVTTQITEVAGAL